MRRVEVTRAELCEETAGARCLAATVNRRRSRRELRRRVVGENSVGGCGISRNMGRVLLGKAEKQRLGYHLEGRSGSRTHVPTVDERVMPGSAAYISDVDRLGCHEGVIGINLKVFIGLLLHEEAAGIQRVRRKLIR